MGNPEPYGKYAANVRSFEQHQVSESITDELINDGYKLEFEYLKLGYVFLIDNDKTVTISQFFEVKIACKNITFFPVQLI